MIHIYIFALETLLWGRPRTNRIFGMAADKAEQNRLFAFNQGYYNLFLSVAALAGIISSLCGLEAVGMTLMAYSAFSMFGASVVLLYSRRKLIRPALAQGVFPLLGLICLVLRAGF